MDRLTSALSAAKEMGSVWVWATGLGPLRNAFPDLFGRELILVFSDGAVNSMLCIKESFERSMRITLSAVSFISSV